MVLIRIGKAGRKINKAPVGIIIELAPIITGRFESANEIGRLSNKQMELGCYFQRICRKKATGTIGLGLFPRVQH
jgi:hypothetical protein